MNELDKIELYLPQYLSSEDKTALKKELASFPTDGTKDTIYTSAMGNANYLLQGDGISDIPYINFPDTKIGKVPGILLSNTCDMSMDNKRINSCRVLFAPLIDFDKYKDLVLRTCGKEKAESHLIDLKKQYITQALFLPKGCGLKNDSIVFFDKAISLPLSEELVQEFCKKKLFTLSNFGFYLFLLKISIHFTRIQEKINRTTGEDLGLKKTP